MGLGRRRFVSLMAAGAVGATAAGVKSTVRVAMFDSSGRRTGVAEVEKVEKTIDQWQAQLTPEQFWVTRQSGTEEPFTGRYAEDDRDGLYGCVCCGTVLFDSKTKFDSGTGWPSFWQPIAEENVFVSTDKSDGMTRDEVRCSRCNAHLGHVFDDGPPPTHLRYCMNSAALKFAPRERCWWSAAGNRSLTVAARYELRLGTSCPVCRAANVRERLFGRSR